MEYLNLKTKTPLDFTSDADILEEILPYVPPGFDRDAFITDYYIQNPEKLAGSFLELAEAIHDDRLKRETQKQFKAELSKFFNE